ncbi:MAG: penicillin-binding protein 1C [Chitinophagales bacterium]
MKYLILNKLKNATKKQQIKWLILLFVFLVYVFCLPKNKFNKPTSTVLLDKNGELLAARIAADQQWRFAELDTIPDKMKTCMLTFEDRNFYWHFGISIKGIVRAAKQNISKQKVVSGGSTITMQTIRLMRDNPSRTFSEKIIEMIMATRLEFGYSKNSILKMYLSNAPFGNNVVGLSAASWRYYGKSPQHLSWSESATLAVLPNAPGLIYPGKNHDKLLHKRNRLLKQLLKYEEIDSMQYMLAVAEPLPDKPLPLPVQNAQILQRFIEQGNKGKVMQTTIDNNIQKMASALMQHHINILKQNNINNAAVIITDLKTGNVVSYIGNSFSSGKEFNNEVDCANAKRSTGSILKPILYAKSLDAGIILPTTILPDVPSFFGSFNPKNFNKTYDGAVPANECVIRSLNIPMVHLLNQYGVLKFQNDLNKAGFTGIQPNTRKYGLSLILGGAEVSLMEINKVYSEMALTLLNSKNKNIALFPEENRKHKNNLQLHKASIYTTFKTMLELNRPDEEGNWRVFESSQTIAWKTGTSFGNRDAWAVGITPNYVVSVWVGNATGEGRPSLIGAKAAAPIMFDLFDKLPKSKIWFQEPKTEYTTIPVCVESGCRAGDACEHIENRSVPITCLRSTLCPYHHTVFVDKMQQYIVNADNTNRNEMVAQNYFTLPPLMQKYYMLKHPEYKLLPPNKDNMLACNSKNALQVVYPKSNSKILIPKEMNGEQGKIVLEAVDGNPNATLFWHIDENYAGQTTTIHQQSVYLPVGKHTLTIIDNNANERKINFEVIN